MPKRLDLRSICVIGSGPIVIGQACEFDYSGCQALKVLREEGFRTIVVNSNPATIMTDPGFADRTYVEPLDVDAVAGVLARERPDALLPTLGGQTALNLAMDLSGQGVLAELGIELIGAGVEVIRRAEDRELFRETVRLAGYRVPASTVVSSWDDVPAELTFPVILRPAFTLGGHGGGTAHDAEEFDLLLERALAESPVGQVLVEESLIGWDEFELELMRDRNDNVVVVCSIENLDPMGVHTGDSVTVAPQMTLPDEAYQELRDAAIAVIREVGVETGGANIQFARERETGELRVIELNPRVSRSSALASKATGYPIAKVAAKLAVGYTLDEIPNDLTGTHSGQLRADARLRRRQVPALLVREVPRRGPDARDADEIRRRGDGDRPLVHRGVPEGAALARARRRLGAAEPPPVVRGGARGRPGSPGLRHEPRSAGRRRLDPAQASRLVGRGDRGALQRERAGSAGEATRVRGAAVVPPRRLLRR